MEWQYGTASRRSCWRPLHYMVMFLICAAILSLSTLFMFHGRVGYHRVVTVPQHPPFQRNSTSQLVTTPWQEDEQCNQHRVRLGINIPQMLLVSFPRSGNTWTRYLVEGATGIFTGSVYRDRRLYKMGYLGEFEAPSSGTTLLIKDHQFKLTGMSDLHPVVLIIRNPKHSITSYYTFRKHKGESDAFNIVESEDDLKKIDFHEAFQEYIAWWEQIATARLLHSRYIHVVLYEALKQNPLDEVGKILQFLVIPRDEERLVCLSQHLDGSTNRGQPMSDPYTAEEKSTIGGAVRRVSALLETRGFPPLPYDNE